MKQAVLPAGTNIDRLTFYLAMEEWVARQLPPDDYFFAWRVRPTVICGRNQDMAREVNLDYCRQEGIDVVRRRSGGGCVYADMDNWMFSYITPGDEIASTFSRYTSMVAGMLRRLGFDARATGRNDIFIGDRKVAGNAFYHIPGRCIVHGTMLCDIDADRMSRAITPSRAKLQAKGVKSVESRITCLRAEGLRMSVEDFGRFVVSELCDANVMLSSHDINAICEIEKAYRAPSFILGRRHSPEDKSVGIERVHKRIESVGEFDVAICLDEERCIKSMSMAGDFFVCGDLDECILRPLQGCPYHPDAIRRRVEECSPHLAVAGLTRDRLVDLLI